MQTVDRPLPSLEDRWHSACERRAAILEAAGFSRAEAVNLAISTTPMPHEAAWNKKEKPHA